MPFREPDDRFWEGLQPILPIRPPHGGGRADIRRLFTGVLYVLTTGVSWADAPPLQHDTDAGRENGPESCGRLR